MTLVGIILKKIKQLQQYLWIEYNARFRVYYREKVKIVSNDITDMSLCDKLIEKIKYLI